MEPHETRPLYCYRFIVIALFASLLISCAGLAPAPQATADVDAIVAQTMAALTANAPNDQMYQGGQAEIVYLDGRPRVMLVPFGRSLKWGP